MLPFTPLQIDAIAAACHRHGVQRLELFDSATGPDFRAGASDYDFLIELDSAHSRSRAMRWIEFAEALEALLGAPVDLVHRGSIRNPYFATEVDRTRQLVYDGSPAKAAV